MVLRLLENAFLTQSIKSIHFYSCPQATLPQVLITVSKAKENYPFPPGSIFWNLLPPKQKGGGGGGGEGGNYGAKKNDQN